MIWEKLLTIRSWCHISLSNQLTTLYGFTCSFLSCRLLKVHGGDRQRRAASEFLKLEVVENMLPRRRSPTVAPWLSLVQAASSSRCCHPISLMLIFRTRLTWAWATEPAGSKLLSGPWDGSAPRSRLAILGLLLRTTSKRIKTGDPGDLERSRCISTS